MRARLDCSAVEILELGLARLDSTLVLYQLDSSASWIHFAGSLVFLSTLHSNASIKIHLAGRAAKLDCSPTSKVQHPQSNIEHPNTKATSTGTCVVAKSRKKCSSFPFAATRATRKRADSTRLASRVETLPAPSSARSYPSWDRANVATVELGSSLQLAAPSSSLYRAVSCARHRRPSWQDLGSSARSLRASSRTLANGLGASRSRASRSLLQGSQ